MDLKGELSCTGELKIGPGLVRSSCVVIWYVRWIPDGQLCPTVPNRSNYIHWIEDLVASDIIEKRNADADEVKGFDIGTGANCIYPLLGASLLGWSFVGSGKYVLRSCSSLTN